MCVADSKHPRIFDQQDQFRSRHRIATRRRLQASAHLRSVGVSFTGTSGLRVADSKHPRIFDQRVFEGLASRIQSRSQTSSICASSIRTEPQGEQSPLALVADSKHLRIFDQRRGRCSCGDVECRRRLQASAHLRSVKKREQRRHKLARSQTPSICASSIRRRKPGRTPGADRRRLQASAHLRSGSSGLPASAELENATNGVLLTSRPPRRCGRRCWSAFCSRPGSAAMTTPSRRRRSAP